MHIKKLVLDNFKSFGRETEIPFYEDFTVITGPNGSGKSTSSTASCSRWGWPAPAGSEPRS
jgi:chromosome segregation ATPase